MQHIAMLNHSMTLVWPSGHRGKARGIAVAHLSSNRHFSECNRELSVGMSE